MIDILKMSFSRLILLFHGSRMTNLCPEKVVDNALLDFFDSSKDF